MSNEPAPFIANHDTSKVYLELREKLIIAAKRDPLLFRDAVEEILRSDFMMAHSDPTERFTCRVIADNLLYMEECGAELSRASFLDMFDEALRGKAGLTVHV